MNKVTIIKPINTAFLILLILLSQTIHAKDRVFQKFITPDFIEYFKNETCYNFNYLHFLSLKKKTKGGFYVKIFDNLKTSKQSNHNKLYNLIKKQCSKDNINTYRNKLSKHTKTQMIENLLPKNDHELLLSKIFCDDKIKNNCSSHLSHSEIDSLFRSKEYYIHEYIKYSLKNYFNNYLSKKIADHIGTENTSIARHILDDAYLLYQCHIGKDCSMTSMYMVEKCYAFSEFCGIDVQTYLKRYKTSQSQFKDIEKALEFLNQY